MAKCSKAEVRRLRTALRWKIPAVQRQRIQMVLLRESGMAQPAIGAAMGVSLSTVNRAHMAYDHGGIKAAAVSIPAAKPETTVKSRSTNSRAILRARSMPCSVGLRVPTTATLRVSVSSQAP
jgi:Winged helix-turn helix